MSFKISHHTIRTTEYNLKKDVVGFHDDGELFAILITYGADGFDFYLKDGITNEHMIFVMNSMTFEFNKMRDIATRDNCMFEPSIIFSTIDKFKSNDVGKAYNAITRENISPALDTEILGKFVMLEIDRKAKFVSVAQRDEMIKDGVDYYGASNRYFPYSVNPNGDKMIPDYTDCDVFIHHKDDLKKLEIHNIYDQGRISILVSTSNPKYDIESVSMPKIISKNVKKPEVYKQIALTEYCRA